MKLTKIFKKTRVWILIFFLILSFLLINYQFNNSGLVIRSVNENSEAYSSGLRSPSKEIMPTQYEKILRVNNQEINDVEDYNKALSDISDLSVVTLETNKGTYSFKKDSDNLGVVVSNSPDSNIKKGLDLQGGTRVLLQPAEKISEQQVQEIISVMDNRLNTYGLTDIQIRSTTDLEGNNFIVVEIAGATQDEVRDLIASQGKFEAKISNSTVFEGGKKDITFVCRNDGTCSGITSCNQVSSEENLCRFEFQISVSPEAAKRQADLTKDLDIVTDSGSSYLSEKIYFYLDDKEVDSLSIGSDLKGVEATNILISGSGTGQTEQEALEDAQLQMNRLQTVLLTGSIPYELEIVKLDSVSPLLGAEFASKVFLAGLVAVLAVSIIILIRFRRLRIAIPVLLTMLSEIVLILGFAVLFKQNLDLASIAGIIAAVGTGVDDQIVIIDETLNRKKTELEPWKTRLKNAFFIIMAAYFATVAAMIPLFRASAGLVKGFAFVTIIGVTIGILLTRPAFAAIVEVLNEE